jgi:hypothetical protein
MMDTTPIDRQPGIYHAFTGAMIPVWIADVRTYTHPTHEPLTTALVAWRDDARRLDGVSQGAGPGTWQYEEETP